MFHRRMVIGTKASTLWTGTSLLIDASTCNVSLQVHVVGSISPSKAAGCVHVDIKDSQNSIHWSPKTPRILHSMKICHYKIFYFFLNIGIKNIPEFFVFGYLAANFMLDKWPTMTNNVQQLCENVLQIMKVNTVGPELLL